MMRRSAFDCDAYLERKDRLLRWLAWRCAPRASVVWSYDDLLQELRTEALALAARYAAVPDDELTYIMLRALPRHARRAIARGEPKPGVAVVFDVDVRDLVDPAWAVPFARSEVLREIDRILVGLPRAVAVEIFDPSPSLAAAVAAALCRSSRRQRYVTVGDVARVLGIRPASAYRAFNVAVSQLAGASCAA